MTGKSIKTKSNNTMCAVGNIFDHMTERDVSSRHRFTVMIQRDIYGMIKVPLMFNL